MKKYNVKNLFVDSGNIAISSLDYYDDNGGILPESMNESHIIVRKPGTYNIKYTLQDSWLEVFKDEKPTGNLTLVTKSGLIAIGDPCYWFQDEKWDTFLDNTNMLENPEENRLTTINTGGDGVMGMKLEIELIK